MSTNQKNVLFLLAIALSAWLVMNLATDGNITGFLRSMFVAAKDAALTQPQQQPAVNYQQPPTGDSHQSTINTAPQFAPTAAVVWPAPRPCNQGENPTETGCVMPDVDRGCLEGKCPDDN